MGIGMSSPRRRPRTWLWAALILLLAAIFTWLDKKGDAPVEAENVPVEAPAEPSPMPSETTLSPGPESPAPATPSEPEAKPLSEQAKRALAPVDMVAPGAAANARRNLDAIDAGIQRQNEAVESLTQQP